MFHALVANLPAGVFFVQGAAAAGPSWSTPGPGSCSASARTRPPGLEHLAEVYRLHRPDGTPYPAEELPVYAGAAPRPDHHARRHRRPPARRPAHAAGHLGGARSTCGGAGRPDAAVWVLRGPDRPAPGRGRPPRSEAACAASSSHRARGYRWGWSRRCRRVQPPAGRSAACPRRR